MRSINKKRSSEVIEKFGLTKGVYDLFAQYQNLARVKDETKMMMTIPKIPYLTQAKLQHFIDERKPYKDIAKHIPISQVEELLDEYVPTAVMRTALGPAAEDVIWRIYAYKLIVIPEFLEVTSKELLNLMNITRQQRNAMVKSYVDMIQTLIMYWLG
ncbi:unnamed protein product [Blepharisma stoltei]|uniref:Uncharacterized protein n=1 Tax=Blepharisma stoltei TaxID=1481888 RepID=A0AAU9IXR3_9CILI|nr:unnamed protein product [Blepharisma stoltei]